MFSHFTRLSLRRCVHTASTTPRPWNRSIKVVLGASAATAAYMTWQLTNERNYLALDSVNPTKITQGSTISSNPPLSPDSSELSTPETKPPDPFIPDPEQLETQGGSPEETSSEASEPSGGGAFNPQTGEINWDCPCLGGMAHGPCGPEFREAFSCFVFSEVEPKGIDCVERFKIMQNCFRAHPDVYADEIMDDDDEDDEPVNSENLEGLPPVVDSSEQIANETAIPESTPEKKLHLQKAGSRDR